MLRRSLTVRKIIRPGESTAFRYGSRLALYLELQEAHLLGTNDSHIRLSLEAQHPSGWAPSSSSRDARVVTEAWSFQRQTVTCKLVTVDGTAKTFWTIRTGVEPSAQ
jgi:hypothetical protein